MAAAQLSEEDQLKFEAELAWCLEQLGASLSSGKLSQKQAVDVNKTYSILRNPKTAYIKKRQLMRASFGDYRAKMDKEEKKFKLEPSLKVSHDLKTPRFIKRKTDASLSNSLQKMTMTSSDCGDELKYDNVTVSPASDAKAFQFEPSSNSFRFNFDVQTESSE